MAESKGWKWDDSIKQNWQYPSEDSVYLAKHWADDGARSILDLGCGVGRHSVFFAQKGFKVTAADISDEAIHFTKEARKENNVDFAIRQADMMKLPFADDAFDRVFSYHVISHQDTIGIKRVIDEITRVLKPDGKVFLTICSKEHCAFKNPDNNHIDENTVYKTEGAEINVPHFFADKKIINELFKNYNFISVRHITECLMNESEDNERSHFYIEAAVKKQATRLDYSAIIGTEVNCKIDRPLGSYHPRHKDIYYPVNYGYVEDVLGGDGAEQDVYILGEDKTLDIFTGKVIAVYHRLNDNEDKWIVAAEGKQFTDEEILASINFQEKYFDGILVR